MRSYQLKSENSKFWAFRKNRQKNFIFSPEITKTFRLVHEDNGRSKLTLSNLKFTKFSIYFKISQKKKKPLKEKISSFFLFGDNKNTTYQARLKKNVLFSMYKKNCFVRLNLKNFFFNPTTYFKKIRKKQKFNRFVQFSSSVYHNFKRTLLMLKKEAVNNELHEFKKKTNVFLSYGINVKKFLATISGISNSDFFQKYNFLSNYLRFFILNTVFFPTKEARVFSDYLEIQATKLMDKTPKLAQTLTLSSNQTKKKKKMNFFLKISKLLSFILTKKDTFFKFLLTHSYKNFWGLKLFDSNFEKHFEGKKLHKKESIFLSSLLPLEKNLFFLKESNLILNFISIFVIPKLISKSIKNLSTKRTLSFKLKHETRELIKSLNFFKGNRALILSERFFKIKKESWNKRSIIFFWYVFLNYQPFFLISITIKKIIIEKIGLKSVKSYFITNESNRPLQIIEKGLNLNGKKKDVILNEEKNFIVKKEIQRIQYNQDPNNNFQKKKFISPKSQNLTKFFEKKPQVVFNSRFPGFLSLKAIQKIVNYVKKNKKVKIRRKILKDRFFLKKNELKSTKKLKLCSPEPNNKLKSFDFLLIDKNKKLNFEINDKTGFIILKKHYPILFFLYLEKTVKLFERKGGVEIQTKKKLKIPVLKKKKPPVNFKNKGFKKGLSSIKCFTKKYIYSVSTKKLDKIVKVLKNSIIDTPIKFRENSRKLNDFRKINKECFDPIIFNKLVQNLDSPKNCHYFQLISLFLAKYLVFFQI